MAEPAHGKRYSDLQKELAEVQAECDALEAELAAIRQTLCDSYKHSDDLK